MNGPGYRPILLLPPAAKLGRRSLRPGVVNRVRGYWVLINTELDQEPFTVLGIPRERMKGGFDDLMARYPDSQWNLQHYAYFACRADDGKTFKELLPKLAVKLPYTMPAPWRGAYTRDYCVTRLGGSKPAGTKPG